MNLVTISTPSQSHYQIVGRLCHNSINDYYLLRQCPAREAWTQFVPQDLAPENSPCDLPAWEAAIATEPADRLFMLVELTRPELSRHGVPCFVQELQRLRQLGEAKERTERGQQFIAPQVALPQVVEFYPQPAHPRYDYAVILRFPKFHLGRARLLRDLSTHQMRLDIAASVDPCLQLVNLVELAVAWGTRDSVECRDNNVFYDVDTGKVALLDWLPFERAGLGLDRYQTQFDRDASRRHLQQIAQLILNAVGANQRDGWKYYHQLSRVAISYLNLLRTWADHPESIDIGSGTAFPPLDELRLVTEDLRMQVLEQTLLPAKSRHTAVMPQFSQLHGRFDPLQDQEVKVLMSPPLPSCATA